MDLHIQGISYKWNLYGLLCLVSFMLHIVFKVIPVVACANTSIPFCDQMIFHCMAIPFCLPIPSTAQLGQIYFRYYELCYEHLCTDFCVDVCFQFYWVYTQEGNCWVNIATEFNFLRKYKTIFQSDCITLHSHLSCIRELASHILAHTCYCSSNSHSVDVRSVIFHFGFDLHFPYDK